MLGLAEAGQMGVNGGDHRALVAEVDLNLPEVLPLFEQMGGVGVTQRLPILHINCVPRRLSIAITRAMGRR